MNKENLAVELEIICSSLKICKVQLAKIFSGLPSSHSRLTLSPKQEKRGNSMRQNYEKLRKKVLELGTINLTDFELNQLLFLEEDLKEEAAQKELMRICAD